MSNRRAPLVRPRVAPEHTVAEIAARLDVPSPQTGAEDRIRGITMATGDIRPDDLYVAMRGQHTHGAKFAGDAQARGARLVLTDDEGRSLSEEDPKVTIPVLAVPDPRRALGPLSAWFYGNLDHHVLTFGITGTNGKTTTAFYMDALLRHSGRTTGLSTTVERHVGSTLFGSALTTPEASQLQSLIATMRELHADAIVLEISAQAMSSHRIDGTFVDVAGFTNLSHEHLNEYSDMEAYYQAKRRLFEPDLCGHAVISLETEWGVRLASEVTVPVTTVAIGADADWRIDLEHHLGGGTSSDLRGPGGQRYHIELSVPGAHMCVNAAMAVIELATGGVPPEQLRAALAEDVLSHVYVPGRLEKVSGPEGPTFFVDYAHTTDAIERTLDAIRAQARGRVLCILGADGGRDPYKRPDMGRAAAERSDILIVDDINPRFEDPATIRAAVLSGARAVQGQAEILEVGDPASAIRRAVALAHPEDTIIVCGPGDEDYHEVRGRKLPYSSRGAAREALREAGWEPAPVPQHHLSSDGVAR
ncbi:MAG: UDP-N-acetylmuramoyl-L-alanyl-D-glutamate--2,6-diaminopimelate ligase [Microbacteriaceae bacterium]|nr:UDP-N-acetylmuramoyl-L-alanyl-D-glutamate--2,6-diaminopimelate ligase [Microbacteriaceae bacterium]MCI1207394.1 UDP-N-acetylmuramoyl-L-alanyl-D-glutamate--2,6-diaminopimelate ligase [Microbacteriaceae bacterium]